MANDQRPQQNQGNQQVQQPKPAQNPIQPTTLLTPEQFLPSKGWKLVSRDAVGNCTWADPKGSNDPPKLIKVAELPVIGETGTKMPVHQLTFPIPPWNHTTVEAMTIQHQRDEYEQKQKVPA